MGTVPITFSSSQSEVIMAEKLVEQNTLHFNTSSH